MAYLSTQQLKSLNFASLGDHVYISDKASIYNPSKISLGSYVRIDDYAMISAGDGGIEFGNFIHIACYACIIGHAKITFNDLCGISIRATILSSTSDFSGDYFPKFAEFKPLDAIECFTIDPISQPVVMGRLSAIGANSIVMPGCTIGEGSLVGAMSFVYKDVGPTSFYVGNPARFIKKLSDGAIIKLEAHLRSSVLF